MRRVPSRWLALTGLWLILLAFPLTALAQTTPGAGNNVATLQPLSRQDSRLSTAQTPAKSGPLLTVFAAVGSGRTNLEVSSMGVEPQNLGVFALVPATRRVEGGLALTALLERAAFANGIWVRIPATYNPLKKTLNFSVTNGMIYAVFVLGPEEQRTLPDSGGATVDFGPAENGPNWWPLLLVFAGLGMIGVYVFSTRGKNSPRRHGEHGKLTNDE